MTTQAPSFDGASTTESAEWIEGGEREGKATFQPIDYVVFASLLLVSAAVGVYFAIKEHRDGSSKSKSAAGASTKEYLMAGRSMTYGPVSMSLIASFMSSVTILGVPAEFYVYGTMFSWFAIPYAILPILVGWVYMPVFYDLGLSSSYEYLKLRFNSATKVIAVVLYMIVSVLYGGVVVYGPSIALSEVTGFNEWIAILTTGVVCIFYTSLGGLKAVIWTDVIQSVVMMSGFVAIIVQGCYNLGGLENIWRAAEEGGRIDFMHFELDPRVRHSFWSITFGGTVFWLAVNGVNQAQVQRYVCCKSKGHAKIAIVLNSVGLIVILLFAGMTGLVIYATYRTCDPLSSGQINKPDQLFPYIVMDILSYIPGIPGVFVAGVYSSSLSTISSGINAMACVTLEDFVRPNTNWREANYKRFSQFLVVLFGIFYILFAYLASVIGGLIKMAYSVLGMIGGVLIGLFTMGLMMPCVNSTGAFIGTLCGFAVTVWKFVGSQLYPVPAEFLNKKNVTTAGCQDTGGLYANYTTLEPVKATTAGYFYSNYTTDSVLIQEAERPAIAYFYDISYIYMSLIGGITTIVVGVLISIITGCNRKAEIREELFVGFLRSSSSSSGGKSGSSTFSKSPPVERSESWMPSSAPLLEQQGSIFQGTETDGAAAVVVEQEEEEDDTPAYRSSLTGPTNEQMERESSF